VSAVTAAVDIVSSEQAQADLRQLVALARGSFADLPGWSDKYVLDVLMRDIVFVARQEAQPAGYVALQREPGGVTIVVEQLFVAPGHEERGVGHRLLAHAEGFAIAEGMQSLRIVAEESNWRARSFYSRSGFVPVEAELLELVLPRSA
jgi:ribosomal protein S18 acetylase RimI-like enzyme